MDVVVAVVGGVVGKRPREDPSEDLDSPELSATDLEFETVEEHLLFRVLIEAFLELAEALEGGTSRLGKPVPVLDRKLIVCGRHRVQRWLRGEHGNGWITSYRTLCDVLDVDSVRLRRDVEAAVGRGDVAWLTRIGWTALLGERRLREYRRRKKGASGKA